MAMDKEKVMPTEREWLIMEAIWDSEDALTSSEILGRIDKNAKLDARTARVLLHHLCKKGLLGYVVDGQDSRVYHYHALRTREECLRTKSQSFVNAYFRGNSSGAVAAFLQHAAFTDEQLKELGEILATKKTGAQK